MRNAYYWLKDFIPSVTNNRTSHLVANAKRYFDKEAHLGIYDRLDDDAYGKTYEAFCDADAFWDGQEQAFSFYIFMRFFNSLELKDEDVDLLARLLGKFAEKIEVDLI